MQVNDTEACTVVYDSHAVGYISKSFSDPSCPVGEGVDNLEENCPIRIEMFHQSIKVILQSKWVPLKRQVN